MSNRNKCLFCFVFPNETANHTEKFFLSLAAAYEDKQGNCTFVADTWKTAAPPWGCY